MKEVSSDAVLKDKFKVICLINKGNFFLFHFQPRAVYTSLDNLVVHGYQEVTILMITWYRHLIGHSTFQSWIQVILLSQPPE